MLGGVTRRRVLGLLAVGLIAAAAGLALHAAGLLNWLERDTVDARFALRGREAPPRDVVLVGIDNDSLGRLPRYPFSRTLDARVLDNLHAAGARLIVYDISFDRPTTAAADDALYEAAQRGRPVVFATSLISPSGRTQVLGGNANLAAIGDRAAAADLLPDADGVLRHTLAEVNGLPTIAAAAVQELGGGASHAGPSNDGSIAKQLNGGWIDFGGPPGTIHSLSFVEVLRDHFNPAAVRGKVVVIGATAPVLQDMHTTAAGSPMSGPEVQASAIATALSGFPLRSPSGVITVILIAGLALLVPLACLIPLAGRRLGTLGAGLAGLGVVCVWTLATQLAFDSGAVLDYTDPLAALLLGTAGAVALGIWVDGRERRRLRALFAADAGGIVEQVLHRPAERRLQPSAIIAGYELQEVIGRGGMGVVYRATQLALGRTVAIKLIAAERAGDPVYRKRFASESRIAASIEHANVIPVYEAGEDDGLLFIAMRLVDGFDLDQLLTRAGPLTPERAAHMIAQVAGALDAAHARGLVHRDVKPANILLTADAPEHAYLSDFGLARRAGALTRVTRAGQWAGTLDYLAPEQIRGEDVNASADIYALTCVLYRCITGQPPFSGESDAAIMWAHVSEPPPSVTAVRPELPSELDDIIGRGMAKDPAERFPTACELAHSCARALGLPIEAPSEKAEVELEANLPESAPTLLSD